jgi:hypothetical protein
MARRTPGTGLRRDRAGAEETFQVVPALIIVIVCVGLVLAAVHGSSIAADARSAEQRARVQAEILLDALRNDAALADTQGTLSWAGAEAVASGAVNLSFLPAPARIVSLTWYPEGRELFVVGNMSHLSAHLLYRGQPVPVRFPDGTVHPGLLRVGVEIS